VNDQLFQPILIYRVTGQKPGKILIKIEEQT